MAITLPNIVADNIVFGETQAVITVTGAQPGDLLISTIGSQWGQSVGMVSSGHDLICAGHGAFKVWAKICTAADEVVTMSGPDPSCAHVHLYRKPAGSTAWRIVGTPAYFADSSGAGNNYWRVSGDVGTMQAGDVLMAISSTGNDPGTENGFWPTSGFTFTVSGATLSALGIQVLLNNGGRSNMVIDQRTVASGPGSAITYEWDYTNWPASTGGTVFLIIRAAPIPIVGTADEDLGLCAEAPVTDTEITLVSPTPVGSAIEPTENVVVDVVDPGVGRTFATTIKVNTVEVYTTAGGWAAGYAVGAGDDDADDITDGSRYTIDPDEDWTECVFVEISVTDEDGLVVHDAFYWQFGEAAAGPVTPPTLPAREALGPGGLLFEVD